MTHTPDELRAAMENAIKVLGLTPDYGIKESSVKQDDADAAILRAHLESFDEERAFMEAAEAYVWFYWPGKRAVHGRVAEPLVAAYRALVAKREEVSK
jgi:hypothetical protein